MINSVDNSVLFEKITDNIALITINRPESSNAFNKNVALRLDNYVKLVERDKNILVAILTGSGDRAFCAGADLKEVSTHGFDALKTPDGGFAGFVNAKRSKVWIAAVNGAAYAGGMELALACDMIIASEHARFALPEVKRGLIALAGGVIRLPRLLPVNIAKEMIVTGDPISALRAYDLGLVNSVVEHGTLIDSAVSLAKRICMNSPFAVRESLKIASKTLDNGEEILFEESQILTDRLIRTEDYVEGPKAFVEKRKPVWEY